jgi:hypothetical protein
MGQATAVTGPAAAPGPCSDEPDKWSAGRDVYLDAMSCSHQGFRSVDSSYDRRSGMLVFYWTCDRCGSRLNELTRQRYRPTFDPRGSELPRLTAGA